MGCLDARRPLLSFRCSIHRPDCVLVPTGVSGCRHFRFRSSRMVGMCFDNRIYSHPRIAAEVAWVSLRSSDSYRTTRIRERTRQRGQCEVADNCGSDHRLLFAYFTFPTPSPSVGTRRNLWIYSATHHLVCNPLVLESLRNWNLSRNQLILMGVISGTLLVQIAKVGVSTAFSGQSTKVTAPWDGMGLFWWSGLIGPFLVSLACCIILLIRQRMSAISLFPSNLLSWQGCCRLRATEWEGLQIDTLLPPCRWHSLRCL